MSSDYYTDYKDYKDYEDYKEEFDDIFIIAVAVLISLLIGFVILGFCLVPSWRECFLRNCRSIRYAKVSYRHRSDIDLEEGRIDINLSEGPRLQVHTPPPIGNDEVPGPSGINQKQKSDEQDERIGGINLIPDDKALNPENRCTICNQEAKNPHELEGKDDKREKIKELAVKMNDKEVLGRIERDPQFKYHNQFKTKRTPKPKNCYKTYVNRAKRFTPPIGQEVKDERSTIEGKRKSSRTVGGAAQQPTNKKLKMRTELVCDICNKMAIGSWPNQVYELFRVSLIRVGKTRASALLSAMKFNQDDLHKKFVFCETIGDIFAADIMYHSRCLRAYEREYQRQIEKMLNNFSREANESVESELNDVFNKLDFSTHAYSLSDITFDINQKLQLDFDNRRTKSRLIKFFGEKISFSYSKDRSQPQIVFGSSIATSQIIEENIRGRDAIQECAKLLASELQSYDFALDKSFCLPNDLSISMQCLKQSRPSQWLKFVSSMFASTKVTKNDMWYLKFDTAFQFFSYWMTKKPTPMHCAISEAVHCMTKSKELIDIMNRLGFSIGYDAMKRVDTDITQMEIELAGDNRCPVNESIKPLVPIQAAVDNFNHKERTDTGGGISNDTVLVIFQNGDDESTPNEGQLSKRPSLPAVERKRCLQHSLPCQELVESNLRKNSGEIEDGYSPDIDHKHDDSVLSQIERDYFAWFYLRKENFENIPSYVALTSKIESAVSQPPRKTAKSFIPILGYPATSMDSIFTSMLNFKDVLKQRGESVGALWCDEGVYCLAKDIQLLKPELFGSIFLGLGPFHWSKIIMGAIGKWLIPSGIDKALTNSGVFQTNVALSSVLKGGDYVKAKDGLNIIAEAVMRLQYEAFLQSEEFLLRKQDLNFDEINFDTDNAALYLYDSSDIDGFTNAWENNKVSLERLRVAFQNFQISNESNENFQYWNIFLNHLFPCARNYEIAVRTGNWELFLLGTERSLEIFFGTGKPNYSRYGSLFYQDCLQLQRKFPGLYKHFKAGNFVCHLTERHGSAVGFDQALEKVYNFQSKAAGGIIGSTRQKKAVALWNIMKHHKDLYVSFLKDAANISEHQGEFNNLHHEFSATAAQNSQNRSKKLFDYVKTIKNPFLPNSSDHLVDITTQESVENSDYLLNCLQFGRSNYEKFIQERLVNKSTSLHSAISFKYEAQSGSVMEANLVAKVKKEKFLSDDQENSSAVVFIEYAASRGWKLGEVINYPLTSRPVFLLEKDSLDQKKAPKFDLTRELLKSLDKESIIVSETNQIPHLKTDAVVIDFMALIRKMSSVVHNKASVTTFGSFCDMILNNIIAYGNNSEQIHVILENYRTLSIKTAERIRRTRATLKAGVLCEVVSEQQPLPSSFDEFFSRMSNKISFQNFFVEYCASHYKSTKPLFLAGGLKTDSDRCSVIRDGNIEEVNEFRASHEEADDRIMYSISQIHKDSKETCCVTVISPDADIFVSLLYHLSNSWQGLKLYLLKKGHVKVERIQQNELYPLHELTNKLSPDLVNCLPAGHALTGCDTVSKVGTKHSLLKALKSYSYLIKDFGLDILDGDNMDTAEQFLVKVVATKIFSNCCTFDELRLKMRQRLTNVRLVDIPCSSNEIKLHISRAYLQSRLWIESASGDASKVLDPTEYGYCSDLSPILFSPPKRPADIPDPCVTCKTCVRITCPCRQKNYPCSRYCKCGEMCKNPLNDYQ